MIDNHFTRGPEGWCSYDYHASVINGRNAFILATWSPTGGVDDDGFVWTDHTCWSADTPEKPLSILPLLHYRGWVDADPVDLRDAEVSLYLRGDGLNLDGARCYFWAHVTRTRWHLTSVPLRIGDGAWTSEPNRFRLTPDESLWHNSWTAEPDGPRRLEPLLAEAESYGISFVGFSSEVTGRLSMSRFSISR